MFLNLILKSMRNGCQSLDRHRLHREYQVLSDKLLVCVVGFLSECVLVILDVFICVVWGEGSCSILRVGKGIVS